MDELRRLARACLLSVAFLLALLAVVTLVLKALLERRMERRAGEGG